MVSDQTIGERIRKLREAHGWSQVQLADLSGLAGPTVNRIENGQRSGRGDTLKKIADALGVTLDTLLSEDEEQQVHSTSLEELTFKERKAIAAWRRGDLIEAVKIITNN